MRSFAIEMYLVPARRQLTAIFGQHGVDIAFTAAAQQQ